MLLASVMNWQPRHSMFGSLFGADDSTPSSAMSFGPGLLGLLSDAKDSRLSLVRLARQIF